MQVLVVENLLFWGGVGGGVLYCGNRHLSGDWK